jgi:hypothetical protein
MLSNNDPSFTRGLINLFFAEHASGGSPGEQQIYD